MASLEDLREGRPRLAFCFERHWHTPLSEYAKLLYQPGEARFSPLFELALRREFQRVGHSDQEAQEALTLLKKKPVLQCAHHVTPTHGPTFLTLDVISLNGLEPQESYLIGASSGIPFSNSAWSGALSYQQLELEELLRPGKAFKQAQEAQREREAHGDSDRRLSLIPAKLRDQLLFGEVVPESLELLYEQMTDPLKELIEPPKAGGSFSSFALKTAGKIQERILGRKVLPFDLNRLVADYLVLLYDQEPTHPLIQLLGDQETIAKLNEDREHPLQLLSSYQGKKSKKLEPLLYTGSELIGPKAGALPTNLANLIEGLRQEQLCPGILLTFIVVAFTEGLHVLGSFNQIDYIHQVHARLQGLGLNWIQQEPIGPSLVTGRMLHGGFPLMPLDLALRNQRLEAEHYGGLTMGELWQHYLDRLT